MGFGPDVVLAPVEVHVDIETEPAYNILASMMILNNLQFRSGFMPWVSETAGTLSDQQAYNNRLLFWGVGFDNLLNCVGDQSFSLEFPEYMTQLEKLSGEEIYNSIIDSYLKSLSKFLSPSRMPRRETLLIDFESYFSTVEEVMSLVYEKDDVIEDKQQFFREVYDLLTQPAQLKPFIINHLYDMWENVLQDEWARALPAVQESVEAYRQLDYSGMTAYEAMRAVTGRDLQSIIKDVEIAGVTRVIFVPSPHSGPYVGWSTRGETMWLMFGMRLPADFSSGSPALSQAEMLMVLDALDDEVRLQILALLSQRGELCAPDIMSHFALSQSTASRHLRQLSATGLVSERRRDGAKKCYTIERGRVRDVLGSLSHLLLDD